MVFIINWNLFFFIIIILSFYDQVFLFSFHLTFLFLKQYHCQKNQDQANWKISLAITFYLVYTVVLS